MAVFLPFELAVQLLEQLCGIRISDDTLWKWVQRFGRQAMQQLAGELASLDKGIEPIKESINPTLMELPLVIAAVREALLKALGVSVPFRAHAGTPKGKIRFQEVKIALLARALKPKLGLSSDD